jgi:hypothetical protein
VDSERYVEPSRKAQIVLLAILVLVALVAASIEPTITRLAPSPSAPQQEVDSGIRELTLVGLGTLVVAFIASVWGVTYFVRLGFRALKLRTFPPPGTIVLRRTRIRTGAQATLAAYHALAFAGLLSVLTILSAYVAWVLASAL